jgi:hypothetical protein
MVSNPLFLLRTRQGDFPHGRFPKREGRYIFLSYWKGYTFAEIRKRECSHKTGALTFRTAPAPAPSLQGRSPAPAGVRNLIAEKKIVREIRRGF